MNKSVESLLLPLAVSVVVGITTGGLSVYMNQEIHKLKIDNMKKDIIELEDLSRAVMENQRTLILNTYRLDRVEKWGIVVEGKIDNLTIKVKK